MVSVSQLERPPLLDYERAGENRLRPKRRHRIAERVGYFVGRALGAVESDRQYVAKRWRHYGDRVRNRERKGIRERLLGATVVGMSVASRGYDRTVRRVITVENENGERRYAKSRMAFAAVGVLAVAGAVMYISHRTGQGPRSIASPVDSDSMPGRPRGHSSASTVFDDLRPRPRPVDSTPAPLPDALTPVETSPQPSVVELGTYNPNTGSGTVWGAARDYANDIGYQQLTNNETWHLTDATLGRNHLTWESARQIPAGYDVQMLMPDEVGNIVAQA